MFIGKCYKYLRKNNNKNKKKKKRKKKKFCQQATGLQLTGSIHCSCTSSKVNIIVQIIHVLYELYALELQDAYLEVVSCKYPMEYKGNINLTKQGGGGGVINSNLYLSKFLVIQVGSSCIIHFLSFSGFRPL